MRTLAKEGGGDDEGIDELKHVKSQIAKKYGLQILFSTSSLLQRHFIDKSV